MRDAADELRQVARAMRREWEQKAEQMLSAAHERSLEVAQARIRELEAERDLTIYYCSGCGRVGQTSADLTRQGCEGRPVEYVPAAERDHWRDGWRMATENLDWARAERDRLREALERIIAIDSGDQPEPLVDIAREAL